MHDTCQISVQTNLIRLYASRVEKLRPVAKVVRSKAISISHQEMDHESARIRGRIDGPDCPIPCSPIRRRQPYKSRGRGVVHGRGPAPRPPLPSRRSQTPKTAGARRTRCHQQATATTRRAQQTDGNGCRAVVPRVLFPPLPRRHHRRLRPVARSTLSAAARRCCGRVRQGAPVPLVRTGARAGCLLRGLTQPACR